MKAAALYDRLNDSANPIAVKELRQAVRSKFIASVILLFLGIEFSVVGIMIYTSNTTYGANLSLGLEAFTILYAILQIACIIFIPMYTGGRMMLEHVGVDIDLTYITTLSPWKVIGGKFLSAFILVVVIYSACAPFMTFTYFMRGIDLPTIAMLLAVGLGASALAIMFSILIGCVPASRPMRGLLALANLGALIFLVGLLMSLSFGLQYNGSIFDDKALYIWLASIGAVVLAVFFVISTAMIAPPTSNRAFPVRLMITSLWLLSGGAAFIQYYVARARGTEDPVYVSAWFYVFTICFSVGFLAAISERSGYPLRIRRLIPRRPWARRISFFFFSGPAGGMLWAASCVVITLAAYAVFSSATNSFYPYYYDVDTESVSTLAGVALFLMGYSLTGLYIRRKFFAQLIREDYTWVLALIVLAVGSVIPSFIGVVESSGNGGYAYAAGPSFWFITNPFALSSYRELAGGSVVLSSLFTAFMYFLNLPWFREQTALFRRPEAATAKPASEQ